MVVTEMIDVFSQATPVSVMVRGTLENVLSPGRLNRLFARKAKQQYSGELLFSTVADLMGLVVLKIRPSIHAAYQDRLEEISVSIASVYNKLNGIEPQVTRALVKETARDLVSVIGAMDGGIRDPLLPGYRTRILDGNHLAGTEHRIKELRRLGAAALPGHVLAVLDPDHRLIVDQIPCEDGHAQERTLLPQVLDVVEQGDVWIADRNFCTLQFLLDVALARRSHFIIRHHAGNVPSWEPVGRKKKVGRVENGVVYEQAVRLTDKKGRSLQLRRITVRLDKPTRDGETEVHIFTNLPKRIKARKIADAYRNRWKIETAFQELAVVLHSEVETLGYPRAALFAFSVALVSYNVLSVVKAALSAVHGAKKVDEQISSYYLANEISGKWEGMLIAIPAQYWTEEFADATPRQLARRLVRLAKNVRFSAFRKHPRGPKKPPPKRKSGNRGNHVATARIIAERKQAMTA